MTSLFGKLGFDFDTNEFGDAQYLSPPAKAFLNEAPMKIDSWMQSDIANGNIQLTDYYKNPLANDCISLLSNTNGIFNIANTVPFEFAQANANNLIESANNLLIELEEFKNHTDNISGVVTMTSNTDTIPSLDTATTIGNQLLRILSVTDNIQNTTPMLGSMTSLFIGEEVNSNVFIIASDFITLNNAISPVNGNCTLSATQVETINTHINILSNYINYRRTSDWNFFTNATIIVTDTMKLTSFNNIGNTQNYLINNLVGTDKLKSDLAASANANTANTTT
jgi:hypothetical protein